MRRIHFGRRSQPPGHPNATAVIVSNVTRHWTAARSLPALAKKYFAFSIAYATESRRIAPVPALGPAKLFKPGKTLFDVRDVKNRSQAFNFHRDQPPLETNRAVSNSHEPINAFRFSIRERAAPYRRTGHHLCRFRLFVLQL